MRFLSLSTLSIKLTMLLCISFMGFMSGMSTSMASMQKAPCAQQVSFNDIKKSTSCNICDMAISVWNKATIIPEMTGYFNNLEISIIPNENSEIIALNTEPINRLYTVYYPPPQALWKAVTPNTKTIVLVV